MRAVVQRVLSARVEVKGRTTGSIGRGLLVLLGICRTDGEDDVSYLAEKILQLRVFPDDRLSMNRSLLDIGGEILLVSQFTLYGDCRRGRRPSFDAAMPPEAAEEIYRSFSAYLAKRGVSPQEGVFGASMVVSLENDGPVTLLLDSEKGF
jgi:D-tyrosyl-tRNA(Tyr) deacylase